MSDSPDAAAPAPIWTKPAFLGICVGLILLISAGAIISLQRYSAQQYSYAVEANELALTAHHVYSAAEYATLVFRAQPSSSPEAMLAGQQAALSTFDLAFSHYEEELEESRDFGTRDQIVAFVTRLEPVRDLLISGHADVAQGVISSTSDSYFEMAEESYLASERYAGSAGRAEFWATLSIAGVFALAFVVSGGLILIYRRAQRRSEAAAAEQEILRLSEARFRPLVQSSSDLIAVVERDGTVRYVSPSAARFTNVSPEEIIGQSVLDFVTQDARRKLLHLFAEVDQRPGYSQYTEIELGAAEGSHLPNHVQVVCTNRIADPDIHGLVLNIRDISEQKTLEEQLRHQAFHDSLTGLANRLRFIDRLEYALERGKRPNGKLVSVLYLDLDHFKNVNDDMGHSAGDELLVQVARRIQSCIRSTDTAARLRGDEFAVLLEDHHTVDEARVVAEDVLSQIRQPFVVTGREVHISASIGVVTADPHHDTAEEVTRNADVAMYDAKENGRGRVHLFEAGMQLSLAEKAALSNDLNGSIERNELEVYYQPTLRLEDGHIAGFEALVRWHHPSRGLIAPSNFIPVAEESGFIHDLGYFVLFEACRQGKEWQSSYDTSKDFAISVNVSARQIQKPGFVGLVKEILEETGFAPASLVLEITETVLIRHPQEVISTLKELKALGLHLALDDFGTGYSSLNYLKRFPIDILKIDRTFIENMDESDRDKMLVQTVIDLGHTLKLDILAEGIERRSQLQGLQQLHCALGQGFLFAEALDAETAEAMLRKQAGEATRAPSHDEDSRVA